MTPRSVFEISRNSNLISFLCRSQLWVRDIPLSVTDKTLSAIFSRFGALRAVTVDRSHGVRQRKWRERKESELRQSQQRELQRTIAKLRETFVDDLTTAYEQQFLRVSVGGGSDGDIETLRLMMAHLQYQFDLCDLLELDAASQSLLVPICSDSTVAAVLAPIAQCEGAEAMSLFQQRGRVIIANAPHTQKLRDALQTHPLVTSIRRTSVEKAELDAALLNTVLSLFLCCAAVTRRVALHVALAIDSAHSESEQ